MVTQDWDVTGTNRWLSMLAADHLSVTISFTVTQTLSKHTGKVWRQEDMHAPIFTTIMKSALSPTVTHACAINIHMPLKVNQFSIPELLSHIAIQLRRVCQENLCMRDWKWGSVILSAASEQQTECWKFAGKETVHLCVSEEEGLSFYVCIGARSAESKHCALLCWGYRPADAAPPSERSLEHRVRGKCAIRRSMVTKSNLSVKKIYLVLPWAIQPNIYTSWDER